MKKLESEGDRAEVGPKMCLLRQSQTKYLKQNRGIWSNWTGKKSLVSIFACFLTATDKV